MLGEAGLRIVGSSPLPCVHKIIFVTAITVPEKSLKLMRDRKEWGSDPRFKRFKNVPLLFSECLASPTQGGSEDRFSSRNIIKLY
jgi:hypothetical protein